MTRAQCEALEAVATPESPEARSERLLRGLADTGLLGLVAEAAEVFHVTVDDIVSRSRLKTVTAARHACWITIYRHHGKSAPEIGLLFGVDHTSVLWALRAAKRRADAQREEVCDGA